MANCLDHSPSVAAAPLGPDARGSVSERTQSSSARVHNRHHSRPRASAVGAVNKETWASFERRSLSDEMRASEKTFLAAR